MIFDFSRFEEDIVAEAAEDLKVAAESAREIDPEQMSPRARYLWAVSTAAMIRDQAKCELKALDSFPPYLAEDENPNILIKGRWLERGGSAWVISTAGTGKSILSVQTALSMTMGLPFAGFEPNVQGGEGLKFWIIQSEDSPSRVTIDREDITAELMEQYPSIDWKEARRRVKFLTIGGKVGAEFLSQLTAVLEIAEERKDLPDIIVINPFLAYIGGPITDGAYVTPFLRGGEINRQKTNGLQHILERFNIAALIFHHTPKPPSEDEIEKWTKATFPEYQGAGSSDITNWGRSFVTMMRVKGEQNIVQLTAGKNGSELGWDVIDGAPRRFLAWSRGKGITGKARHAWRELTDEEFARVTNDAVARAKSDVDRVVESLKAQPMTANQIAEYMTNSGMKRGAFRSAWKDVSASYAARGLACVGASKGRTKCWFFGLPEAAKMAAWRYETEDEN